MIKTEKLTINGKEFVRTYSDSGLQIERDGALYDEAIDPADSGRTYTESADPSVYYQITDAEYNARMEGEQAEAADYEAALARLGVE